MIIRFLISLLLISSISAVDKVKLYSMCTPSHNVLKDGYFLPSIQDDFELHIQQHDQICRSAQYMKRGWNDVMKQKVDVIIAAIRENWGKTFVFSDVDIQFFKSFKNMIPAIMKDKDIVIQKADPSNSLCAGFFICKGNTNTLKLWLEIKKMMAKDANLDDQTPLNILLIKDNKFNVKWGLLPDQFYNPGLYTGKMWSPSVSLKLPANIILHHACFTVGVTNKIKQLEYVKGLVKDNKK